MGVINLELYAKEFHVIGSLFTAVEEFA